MAAPGVAPAPVPAAPAAAAAVPEAAAAAPAAPAAPEAPANQGSGGAAPAAAAAVNGADKKVVSAESGAWTEEQEVALVKALKQFGKELGTERWEKVAGVVPGKTKGQCFKRFKELREAFRAKKAAGGGAGGEEDEE